MEVYPNSLSLISFRTASPDFLFLFPHPTKLVLFSGKMVQWKITGDRLCIVAES